MHFQKVILAGWTPTLTCSRMPSGSEFHIHVGWGKKIIVKINNSCENSSMGLANCHCGWSLWNACRRTCFSNWVYRGLLRLRKIIGCTTTSNTCHQSGHRDWRIGLHHCRYVWNRKWYDQLFRKHWCNRRDKGESFILEESPWPLHFWQSHLSRLGAEGWSSMAQSSWSLSAASPSLALSSWQFPNRLLVESSALCLASLARLDSPTFSSWIWIPQGTCSSLDSQCSWLWYNEYSLQSWTLKKTRCIFSGYPSMGGGARIHNKYRKWNRGSDLFCHVDNQHVCGWTFRVHFGQYHSW